MRPALVLSGHTMGLCVVRALGAEGIPVVAVHYADADVAQVSRYATESLRTPRPLYDEEAFVEVLLDRSSRYDNGLLIPASDSALVAVSKHRAALQERYVVAAPAWDVARSFIDKARTYALAEAAGIPAPRTAVPASREEAERYADDATYPCLVKPSVGHVYRAIFGTKMKEVANRQELLRAYQEAADEGIQVMLQELIPGPDDAGANYNAYVWDGRPLAEFTAAKIRSAPPRVGSPCVVRSQWVDGVVEPGRAILEAMGYEGFACTEFKRDPRDDTWKLLEVNGRHNLSGMLAVRCGINFPLLQYRHLMEGIAPSATGFQPGVYWIDLVRDLREARQAIRRDGLRSFTLPYRGHPVYAVGDLHDPKPFVVQAAKGLRVAFRRLAQRRAARALVARRSTKAT